MRKNVRTSTIKKHTGKDVRLSESDRQFLHDLTRVGIIDEHSADTYHYSDMKMDASKRLDTLCEAGLLERTIVHERGKPSFKSYTFANRDMAILFGGKKLELGGRRNAHHEVILSKLYFAEGRPETFKVEADLSQKEKDFFKTISGKRLGSCLPDAVYYDSAGELVVVEADSGQYSQKQVQEKQSSWGALKQVWGQPSKASAKIRNASVHRFD